MGHTVQAPALTDVNCNQHGQTEVNVELRKDVGNRSRHLATRIHLEDPPFNESDETDLSQDVERRSRKTDSRRMHHTAKASEDIIRDPKSEHDNRLPTLGQRFYQLKTRHSILREKHDHLKVELGRLASDNMTQEKYATCYTHVVNRVLLPYAQDKRLHFDDRTADTLDFVLGPLSQDAREAETLRDQVKTLQKELLAREKFTGVITDQQFASDFRKLAAQIKSLSRLLQPNDDPDVVETLGSCVMASGVTLHHWNSRVGRKLYIEVWTWSILMQMVFQNPFAIFGDKCRTIANLWVSIFGTQHCHNWPNPSFPCESWRYGTMKQLLASVDVDIITQGKAKKNYSCLERQLVDARAGVIDGIATRLATITPTVDSSQVLQIVDGAFDLAMKMSLQQSRLQINFPKSGENFCKAEMKLLSTLDENDGGDQGVVAAIVNPGLMKWGDAQGRKFDNCYAIVPALVQLQPSRNSEAK